MKKKQLTAVEWLVEKLNAKYFNNDFIITYINEIEQAKQMEKEQIINAHIDGYESISGQSENYYNEIYGK